MSLSSDKFQDGNFGSRELKSEDRVGKNGPEIKSNNLGLKMVSLQVGTSNADRIAESLQAVVVPATNGRTATWTARSTRAGTRHRVSEGQQVRLVLLVWAAALLVGSASAMASAAGNP